MLHAEPDSGQVVITRFECPNLAVLAYLLVLHVRIKRAVHRHAPALIAARVVVQWRRRTMLSISLWPDLDSIFAMGSVRRHVIGSRVPGRLGVRTSSGIFTFTGDWRRVMFGSPSAPHDPLQPLNPT
ncbi:hypothetical protein KZZ52_17230 [Dactylosporangium sp. AC04546]|uniref:hypothetical protein n=1 Tax=Dactylosporangium sp. AC04546 TaxID=2862460 RepID=UPI001EDFFE93|nr:hypothetical protein [Dactylosporangium sp. AC04546]WVK87041.1 hypothetical protein KZZ52_17230 [Dactylosporangium sp. AC04546]